MKVLVEGRERVWKGLKALVGAVGGRGEADERGAEDVFLALGDRFCAEDEDDDDGVCPSKSVLRLFLGRPMGF